MAKSSILIKEETSKDENNNTILKRKVIAKMVNRTIVIYEDVILAKDFISDDSPISRFEQWAINLHKYKSINE